jgi:2-polyprenyl-6-methoxyphenol hydroxylase-like FAD-dependent oxidoreductase
LRDKIAKSPYCTLRKSCKVVDREELEDGVIVEYQTDQNIVERIKCSYLIGADGKTGVVRKQFLEPTAGIRQKVGLFKYTGTWVAANLKIRLPTPESHPQFLLWELGFSPEDVYDLFWPAGWHFCSPPGKATACGRFGPIQDRFWRHEFAEPDWDDSKDSVALLWEHLLPLLTRGHDSQGRRFQCEIMFPRDCIEIRRCRPFTFCQKVVNKWFHKRTILIGDAAHVFPPFGGQGIACGIRDAHGLAWRLAVLQGLPSSSNELREKMLEAWSMERRQGVDDSARFTRVSGVLVNRVETWTIFFFRKAMEYASNLGLYNQSQLSTDSERAGYIKTKEGFFLESFRGGGKVAQVYVRSGTDVPILSDELLKQNEAVMTMLVVGENDERDGDVDVRGLLKESDVPATILSSNSLVFVSLGHSGSSTGYTCCSQGDLGDKKSRPGYKANSYIGSLPPGTKYAIIRPDFIIFAAATSLDELRKCLELLREMLCE